MLAKPVEQLPPANALPGGCRYEPKRDGYLFRTRQAGAALVGRTAVGFNAPGLVAAFAYVSGRHVVGGCPLRTG